MKYPHARRDSITDVYHGTPIEDPYRWLEDPTNPETQSWGEEQVTLAMDYLRELPARNILKDRLTHVWNTPKQSVRLKRGNRYFYFQNDGLQNQDVLMLDDRAVIDPNTFSTDGTVALSNFSINDDGTLIAYATSSGGTDWQEIRVRNVDTGEDYPDVLMWCKFTNAAWLPDSSGFFYSRYPEQDDIHSPDTLPLNNKVYLHRLGTSQADDELIYEQPDNPDLGFNPNITDDDQYLWLDVWYGAINRNMVYYRPLKGDTFIRLIPEADAEYNVIGTQGSTFYIQTDLDAPRGRVIAIDVNQPDVRREIIAEDADHIIGDGKMINHQIVLLVMQNASHHIKIYGLDGQFVREITLPGVGSVGQMTGKPTDSEMFIDFQSVLLPPTIYRYDFKAQTLEPLNQPSANFDADQYQTTQVFYPSKDGTQVSMFITHRKDMQRDGENPLLLFGYGGFSIPLLPGYQPHVLAWLESGGIYAVANLRGGSEYGEAWHQAGMLENKQNVFDDFISAAEWLIQERYTRREKLAIMGRSNGGLLVAACMVQRPDLFGAVICNVPVIDMLRYHRFTAGRYWTPEYGDAEKDPAHFDFLRAYSPLHNIQEGTAYPPTLILSADLDDRVVPMHAKKFAAALQHATTGEQPILLRLDTRSGHGHGKPTSKWIEEWADIYGFLLAHLSG